MGPGKVEVEAKELEVVAVYVDRIERRDDGVGTGRMGGGEGRNVAVVVLAVVEVWMLAWMGVLEFGT